MKRLTKRTTVGAASYDYPPDCYFDNGCMDEVAKSVFRQNCVERLAAYEDTGLEPESVEALKLSMMGKAISEITEFDGSTCNRKPDGFCAYRLRNDGADIGKKVFLTREEAEAALEAMKDGN